MNHAFALGAIAAARPPAAINATPSLLLHLDGANGSTSMTDSGPNGLTVTAFGNAQLSTASPKFGTAALLLDGSGDYLRVPYHPGLHLSTGDFTIDMWVNLGSAGGQETPILSLATTSFTYAWNLFRHSGGYIRFAAYNESGSLIGFVVQSTGTIGDNTWRHIAVTRSGNTFRLFTDGVLRNSATSSDAIRPSASGPSYQLTLGAYPSGAGGFNGQIDEVRIVDGTAVWVSDFTPPAAPYP